MPADLAPPVVTVDSHVYEYGSPNSTISFKSINGDVTGSISHESVIRCVFNSQSAHHNSFEKISFGIRVQFYHFGNMV